MRSYFRSIDNLYLITRIESSSLQLFLMTQWLILLLGISQILTASTSPLLSNFGNNFRSAEVTITIASQVQHDISDPFPSALPNSPVTLALSMTDYSQSFDPTYKVHYLLLENTPTPSTTTNALFRVELGFYLQTTRAKVKYLACPTSILDSNFQIIVREYTPGNILTFSDFEQNLVTPTLNTAGSFTFPIWISGLKASKSLATDQIYVNTWFMTSPNLLRVYNMGSTTVSVEIIRITLIFMNNAATTISGTYRLPYRLNFYDNDPLPVNLGSFSSWFDTTNIICGLNFVGFTSNIFEYTYLLSDNTVSLTSSVTPGSHSYWSTHYCLIAGAQMCPTSHPFYALNTELCYDSCPGQNPTSNLCSYGCPLNCDTCSSGSTCTLCSSGFYMRSDNMCYSFCLAGTFPNFPTCDLCPTGCETCTSLTTCQICSISYYLRADNLCYLTCPSGHYPQNVSRACILCPLGCADCTSMIACQTCTLSFYLRLDNLCYSACPAGYYPETSNLTCNSCPTECETCSSPHACITCSSSGSTTSGLCSNCVLGHPVSGGCTQTDGCKEVVYINPTDRLGTCITCNDYLIFNQSECICQKAGDVLIDGQCYPNVVGCTSLRVVSGEVRCYFCSLVDNFVLDSSANLCGCSSGYSLEGQSCKDTCGDGTILESECDDGNTEDGDGCSSSCQIQINYKCQVTSGISSCSYVRKGISVSLVKVQRIGKENEAVFTFAFSPNPLTILLFPKANHLFSLFLDNSTEIDVVWTYDGQLKATGPFYSTIQGQTVLANFTFDQNFIQHESLFLNFTIESSNIKLEYFDDPWKIVTFNGVLLGISCASLVLLLLGSFLHKMIGVQFLHSLQLIYYLHFLFKDYTLTISSFQSLSFVALNNLYWQSDRQNIETNQAYQKVDYSVSYTELSIIFLAITPLFALVGSIVYQLIKFKFLDSGNQEDGEQLIPKIRRRLYHGFIFPIGLGFVTSYILANFSLSMTTSSLTFSPIVICIVRFLVSFFTSVVLTIQILMVPFNSLKNIFTLAKQSYIPIYVLHWIVMVLLIWLQIRLNYNFSLIIMEVLGCLMIFFLIFYRPYHGVLDTVGSVANVLLQLSFILTVQLRNSEVIQQTYDNDLRICLVISVFIVTCFILNLARVILACCCRDEIVVVKVKENLKKKKRKKRNRSKVVQSQMNTTAVLMSHRNGNPSIKQILLSRKNAILDQEKQRNKKTDAELKKKLEKMRDLFPKSLKNLRQVKEEGYF